MVQSHSSADSTGSLVGAQSTGRLSHIQGLRAVAVLAVVLFHAETRLVGGFLGVDAFFVISGVVITSMIVREIDQGTFSLRSFYGRRVRRLLPALTAMLIVVAAFGFLLQNPLGSQQRVARVGIAASAVGANVQLMREPDGYFDSPAAENPLLHTWSLAVEEQFYLLFPPLLVGAAAIGVRLANRRKREFNRRAVFIGLGTVLTASSFAFSLALSRGHQPIPFIHYFPDRILFYSSPSRAWQFGLGALVALLFPALHVRSKATGTVLSAIGAAVLAYTFVYYDSFTTFPSVAILPSAATVLLVLGGQYGVGRILATKPFVWLGDLSYSWYLWHWPIIVSARILFPSINKGGLLITAVASLLPAWLSFRFVETPIRFKRLLPKLGAPILAGCCLAFPAASFASLGAFAAIQVNSDASKAMAVALLPHDDIVNGCNAPAPLGERTLEATLKCTWPKSKGTETSGSILLVGDSQAGHFSEAVIEASKRLNLSTTIATHNGCAFTGLDARMAGTTARKGCQHFVRGTVDDIERLRPDVVIIATASGGYINGNDYSLRDPKSLKWVDAKDGKRKLLIEGFGSIINKLQGLHIRVIIVNQVYTFKSWRLDNCTDFNFYRNACSAARSRDTLVAARKLGKDIELEAATGKRFVSTLDVADRLCEASVCSTQMRQNWNYFDGGHITRSASLNLAGDFEKAIRASMTVH